MSLPKIIFDGNDINNHQKRATEILLEIKKYKKSFSSDLWQYKYLEYMESNIINILTDDNIDFHKDNLDKIYKFRSKDCNCAKNLKGECSRFCQNKFSAKVQIFLGYDHSSLIKYFLYNGNKTCYICNAQYTVTAQKDYLNNYKNRHSKKKKYISNKQTHVRQNRNKAKFQLDHYYPKSLYPALSISLHNLFPICGTCNQVKSDSVLDIKILHANSKFELEEISILNFYKSQNRKELVLHINDNGTNGLVEKFDLKGIYDNHIDTVEELLVRKIKYSDSYKKSLIKRHKGLAPNFSSIEDRLIVGTYDKSEGIYKRPLSKLLHDINDQLDDLYK